MTHFTHFTCNIFKHCALLVNLRSKLQSKASDRYLERASIPLESLWKVAVVVKEGKNLSSDRFSNVSSAAELANALTNINRREKNELFSPISDFGPMVLIVLTDLCTRFCISVHYEKKVVHSEQKKFFSNFSKN